MAKKRNKLRDFRAAELPLPPKKPARRALPRVAAASVPARPSRRSLRLSLLLDSLAMRAGRRLLARLLGNLFEIVLYALIAATIGFASAWYMMDAGSRLTVERDGPWQTWTRAGAPDADPYTKAHFVRAGWLALNSATARYYLAAKDSSGEAMFADCDYTVSGAAPAGRRWSLEAFDMQGRGIDPGPGRAVLTSATALFGPEGTLGIAISSTVAPGNWLSVTGSARIQLLLTVFGRTDQAVKAAGATRSALPAIVKTGCR